MTGCNNGYISFFSLCRISFITC
ncbi:hypothetical protein IM793_05330 [Pedobacter sp. MR2016-19]|nr:hypothetical protein [Pedobacter sp. MR2016-19]